MVGHAVWFHEDSSVACQDLQGWLSARAAQGFPGWLEYIRPLLSADLTEEVANRLFDSIRYH
jgi:hypothetical protein